VLCGNESGAAQLPSSLNMSTLAANQGHYGIRGKGIAGPPAPKAALLDRKLRLFRFTMNKKYYQDAETALNKPASRAAIQEFDFNIFLLGHVLRLEAAIEKAGRKPVSEILGETTPEAPAEPAK